MAKLAAMAGPPADLTDLVRQLSAPDPAEPISHAVRARRISQLSAALASSGRGAGSRAVLTGQWLADLVEQITPHLTVRDRATLERTYGCVGDELAAAVIRSASRVTGGLGAAAGALAAAELVAPPTLMAVPVQVAAETLTVVAVELRLLGELHEVYGLPVLGTAPAKASTLLTAWTKRRAFEPGAGVLLLGAAARRELRKRILRRLGGSATTMAPFLAGALAGAEINRRETRKLGESVAGDLRLRAARTFAIPPGR